MKATLRSFRLPPRRSARRRHSSYLLLCCNITFEITWHKRLAISFWHNPYSWSTHSNVREHSTCLSHESFCQGGYGGYCWVRGKLHCWVFPNAWTTPPEQHGDMLCCSFYLCWSPSVKLLKGYVIRKCHQSLCWHGGEKKMGKFLILQWTIPFWYISSLILQNMSKAKGKETVHVRWQPGIQSCYLSAHLEKSESTSVIVESSDINNDHATHALGFLRLQLRQ